MVDTITVTGTVGSEPTLRRTKDGHAVTNFRLASTQRRYDAAERTWSDGPTSWFTVTAFRGLAGNVAASIRVGQPVLVTGALRVRDWESDGKQGRAVEIDASAVGHDLTFGHSSYTRSSASADSVGASSRNPVTEANAFAVSEAPADAGEPVSVPF